MLEEDKYVIAYALQMWKNYVETNNVKMDAESAIKQNMPENINALTDSQKEFTFRLKKLHDDILTEKKIIKES